MAETAIEWTHGTRADGSTIPGYTFNPWRGCTKVSPGCAHCYAEVLSGRNHEVLGEWGPAGKRVIAAESYWRLPLRWDKEAAALGERRKVFCLSLGDFAEERLELVVPRQRLFELIGRTQNLDWVLLTKRPEVAVAHWPLWAGYAVGGAINAGLSPRCPMEPTIPSVWLGVSVEDQRRADERIPLLLQIPAAIRFLSCEPLLGPVDLEMVPRKPDTDYYEPLKDGSIHWVIAGGESGAKARPMHPDWARSLRDHCQAAGVPFFFKQWGEWGPGPAPIGVRSAIVWPDGRHEGPIGEPALACSGRLSRALSHEGAQPIYRVGKKAAGRLLDGREWSEFPATE